MEKHGKNNNSMINEQRLFSLLPSFFDKPENVYVELAQNSQRAGAKNLALALNGSCLTVSDDGKGTDNAEALVTLADSHWTEEVEKNQCPAGWGLFFLVCISEQVTFKSRFGCLSFECDRYLENAEYRSSVLDLLNEAEKASGFYAGALLKEGIAEKMKGASQKLAYFPLDIAFNGSPIKKMSLAEDYKSRLIKTQYQGNACFMDPFTFGKTPTLEVVWYGIHIEDKPLYHDRQVAIDVVSGSPLTPVLPYRHTIKEDAKLDQFREFCRGKVVEHCTEAINNPSEGMRDDEIIKLMNTMSAIATQEELDRLCRFFVSTTEPYYSEDYWSDSTARDVIVRKDSSPITDEVVSGLYLCRDTGKTEVEDWENTLTLPAGTVTAVNHAKNAPSWLKEKIVEKKIGIEIHPIGESRDLNYAWQRSIIKCEKEIAVLALVEYSSEGTVYYADSPEDFYEIQGAVFARKIFSDDGDTWDSQEYYFNEDVNKDITKLLGKFSVYNLLEGLRIADISPEKVTEIKVAKGSMVVKFKDGGKKTLKIAA